MFERQLALRYIRSQKRHSIFTVSSIAVALALMALLFIGYSTYTNVIRESAYYDKPYHFKMLALNENEFAKLSADPDFISCKRVDEADGSISAEIMLKTYHDDFGIYINTLFPEKYIYSDLTEEFKTELIDVNYPLVNADQLEFPPKYEAIRNLALFFIFILFLVLALRLMIDTAFEISSKERERQFGMLQCMGASPKQIVRVITFEGLFLSIAGIPLGLLLGFGLSFLVFQAIRASGIAEAYFTPEKAAAVMHLHFDPLLLLLAAVTGLVWVFLSAYQTGMRVIKISPIQAINGRSTKIIKVRKFSLFGSLFGWMGKLAARNNHRQFKRFIITVVSLTLSLLLFSSFSVVLNQLMASFEKVVSLLNLNYDMGIAVQIDTDDPLSYREGLERIRSSGYFELDDFSEMQIGYVPSEDGSTLNCAIMYYPKEIFAQQFEGELPVTYEELTEQNGYLAMMQTVSGVTESQRFDEPSVAELQIQQRAVVSDADYEKMSDTEKESVKDAMFNDPVTGEERLKYRYTTTFEPVELKIFGTAPEHIRENHSQKFSKYQMTGDLVILVGTLDTYENTAYQYAGKGSLINEDGAEYVHVNLKNEEDYEAAKQFIQEQKGVLSLYEDFYGDLRKMRAGIRAVSVGVAIMSVLIGIIALVNMVNILYTGILNRKTEFAAMQCLGMTQKQLTGMMTIESLQYALTSGVLATLLHEGLMYVMLLYLRHIELDDVFGEMLNFTEPLPRIWIASAVIFAAAVLASLIPLHRLRKESLIDRIRMVE
ncbi:MAG: ABC transporter permease [Oscillospiraceae bacterium]|nr:ABC transporter permease [Oscillospiraceae bacterium]